MRVPIGLHLTSFAFSGIGAAGRVSHALTIAQEAESAGFDTLWLNDHLIETQPP